MSVERCLLEKAWQNPHIDGKRTRTYLGFMLPSCAQLWAVLRIRIEKMRMRIQEKILMRMRMRIRMRIHALTELWLASNSIRNL